MYSVHTYFIVDRMNNCIWFNFIKLICADTVKLSKILMGCNVYYMYQSILLCMCVCKICVVSTKCRDIFFLFLQHTYDAWYFVISRADMQNRVFFSFLVRFFFWWALIFAYHFGLRHHHIVRIIVEK